MGIGGDELVRLIILIVGVVLFFLMIREFWCWYFKINARLDLLVEIRDLLKKQGPTEAA